ncbi:hypothetical protein PIB30_033969 [Stylosanthes scabra]|uniref:Putative plant transposon protein domain-containing protein n=1 Tax=Stylosanthes scabra TaxID=79078 RepID=A0ABU6RCU0_9FABA|nr:hypothetical protein [Stylosanthes scabra]
MSDRKQKGKDKVKARDQRKFAKSKLPTTMCEEKRFDGVKGMDDMLKRMSSETPNKFPNQYSQRKFREIGKRSLHFERRLENPDNLLKFVAPRIEKFKLQFIDRELVQVNDTWVREFYSNLHDEDLNSVFLRGKQIPITEVVIQNILKIPAPPKGKDDFQKAKEAQKTYTFKWNLVLDRLTKPGSSWVPGKIKLDPTGIQVDDLTIEACLWQQILTNYVMPSTHDGKITSDMALLIWCVLEEKQVYLPRLIIRESFGKIHKFGNLAFPCLITQMALKLNVEWDVEDYKPIVPRSKELIPHGIWYKSENPAKRKRTNKASSSRAGTSEAEVPQPTPPHQRIHELVHQLIKKMDCNGWREKRYYEYVKKLIDCPNPPPEELDTPETEQEHSADESPVMDMVPLQSRPPEHPPDHGGEF